MGMFGAEELKVYPGHEHGAKQREGTSNDGKYRENEPQREIIEEEIRRVQFETIEIPF